MEERLIPYNLSTPDKTLADVFNNAFVFTLNRYATAPEEQAEILQWCMSMSTMYSPMSFMTTDALMVLHETVFSTELNRDFIFSLYANFRMRYSANPVDWDNLCILLESAVSVNTGFETDLFPKDLAERILNSEATLQVIRSNAWLVMILLIVLYWNNFATTRVAKNATSS